MPTIKLPNYRAFHSYCYYRFTSQAEFSFLFSCHPCLLLFYSYLISYSMTIPDRNWIINFSAETTLMLAINLQARSLSNSDRIHRCRSLLLHSPPSVPPSHPVFPPSMYVRQFLDFSFSLSPIYIITIYPLLYQLFLFIFTILQKNMVSRQ